jgi:outer membrane protein assembly factor BamB
VTGVLLMCWMWGAEAGEWPAWRGPGQTGTSDEPALSAAPDAASPAWTLELASRSTPVVWGDRAYVWGYEGSGPALQEVLVAINLATGAELWRRPLRDFLSDIIYDRYSIGAPAVDPTTGQVVVQTSAGDLIAFTADGVERWRVPLMESLGRLTFPNGRTGAPVLVEGMVIVHGITTNWGREGPARDRFYAFDADDGALLWSSTPGVQPQDGSWSTPLVVEEDGRLTLYCGTGSGELVALDARTGEALWRTPVVDGGVNVSPVKVGELVIVSHAAENLDSTKTGGMFGVYIGGERTPGEEGAPANQTIRWRNDIAAFSSSPVLSDGVIYQVGQNGVLYAVDGASGQVLWEKRLGTDQLHASPTLAGGVLYVPMRDGTLWSLKVSRAGAEVIGSTKLEGEALGAPAVAHGRLLVTTTKRLYAFGAGGPVAAPAMVARPALSTDPAVALRVHPAEVTLRPGETTKLSAELLDAKGRIVKVVAPESVTPWIPPTAKVKSEMRATWKGGALVAPPDAGLTAGAFQVKAAGLTGTFRGRTVSGLPYSEDFEAFPTTEVAADGSAWGWPPLPWIGARFKWVVEPKDGSLVFGKTLDRLLFQRSVVFVGHQDETDYGMLVDVMSDGDPRQMSAVGVVHQRYIVAVKGNQRVLEISSNQERLKESVPFTMVAGVWYRLRTAVTVEADGTAVVRAKAWPRGEAEPTAWTIEVRHANGHRNGAPGLFGFTPQNRHSVYIDNLAIRPASEVK